MTPITPTTPPPEGCIDTQVIGHVLLIGINRPAKRNGWTPPMFRQLAEAYTRQNDDPELRVGVLHAFGDHFTAGLDLPAVSAYMQRGDKAIPEGLVEPHDYGPPGYRRQENLLDPFLQPRWSAIGTSGRSGGAAWAHAHASGRGVQSPDFTPTLRARGFSGGLRRCGTCG